MMKILHISIAFVENTIYCIARSKNGHISAYNYQKLGIFIYFARCARLKTRDVRGVSTDGVTAVQGSRTPLLQTLRYER